jgi:hypothetical protein
MLKRFLLLTTALIAAVPLVAFTPTAASRASQNTGTVGAVTEPVISVQSINGVTHGAVAFMDWPDATNTPFAAQIQVAHTYDSYTFANWSTPITLPLTATNGVTYNNSADPVFIEYGNNFPYQNWLFCFGTLYTNTPYHGKSTIGAWHSTDGGITWSAPDAIDVPPYNPSCESAGTCTFDDKPAAALSAANGAIYVAFTRTTASTTAMHMVELLPTRGWADIGLIGEPNTTPIPGPTPVIDPTTNTCYLFVMDRVHNTIRTFSSGDGWTWTEIQEVVSAPGIDAQSVTVGATGVRSVPFLSGKFDSVYHHILLVYHRQEPGGIAQVVSRRFSPPSHAWAQPQIINPNGHTQWNPEVVQMSNGHFVVTYYDYNPGDAGYTLFASRMNLYGIYEETGRIFNSEFSNPAQYNLEPIANASRIGEYQGLTLLNDTLYAATIYIPQSTPRVGNAWVVRFTTP